jgi:hypothetical protein
VEATIRFGLFEQGRLIRALVQGALTILLVGCVSRNS